MCQTPSLSHLCLTCLFLKQHVLLLCFSRALTQLLHKQCLVFPVEGETSAQATVPKGRISVGNSEIETPGVSSYASNQQSREFSNYINQSENASQSSSQRKRKNRWDEKAHTDTPSSSFDAAQMPSSATTSAPAAGPSAASQGSSSSTDSSQPIDIMAEFERAKALLQQKAKQILQGAKSTAEIERQQQIDTQLEMQAIYRKIVEEEAFKARRKKRQEDKPRYEYDSDEEIDGGTWEHKKRKTEMQKTLRKAESLTEQARGKHHMADFLPPEELARFQEKVKAIKEGRIADLSDYAEFKLKDDNIGYKLLQKAGWQEGKGLGSEGKGIKEPINKGSTSFDNSGVGATKVQEVAKDDTEFDVYRKRMMLAYKFRPNPLNNPRRPYY